MSRHKLNGVLSVLVLLLSGGWLAAQNATPLTEKQAKDILEFQDYIYSCRNLNFWKLDCGCAGTFYAVTGGGEAPPECSDFQGGSIIDKRTLNHHHIAHDYSVDQGAAGCSSCGGGSPGAGVSWENCPSSVDTGCAIRLGSAASGRACTAIMT